MKVTIDLYHVWGGALTLIGGVVLWLAFLVLLERSERISRALRYGDLWEVLDVLAYIGVALLTLPAGIHLWRH